PAPTDTRHKRATTAPKPGGCASPTRRNSPMSWRVARSLETLRDQINARYPNRNRASDGTIGDAAHATRDSDHNPWVRDGRLGVVTALDITHDPAHGVDIDRLTDELQASRDPRIKYVIANGLIMDTRPGFNPWRWVRYTGSNPHTRHFHLSVMPDKGRYDDTRPWNLPSLTGGTTSPGRGPMSKGDALAALREYFNSKWHEPPQPGNQPDVSLRDEILRSGSRTYALTEKRHENAAGNAYTLPHYVVNTNDRL